MSTKRRILYAYYMKGWVYGKSDKQPLVNNAQRVQPLDYDTSMKGWIFARFAIRI
jgi:hypothetical protein